MKSQKVLFMFRKYCTIFCLFIITVGYGQTVSTLVNEFEAGGQISIDKSGNVIASNFSGKGDGFNPSGSTVKKISLNGSVSTFIAGLKTPTGNTFDKYGNFYVSNYTTGQIIKVSVDGKRTIIASGLDMPGGIVSDADGNLFVGINPFPKWGKTIFKIDPKGNLEKFITHPDFNGPSNLTITSDGTLYVANYRDGKIFKIGKNKTVTQIAQVPGSLGFSIGQLTSIKNTLYATAISIHKILKITSDGKMSVIAGNGNYGMEDGQALESSFRFPLGITPSLGGDSLFVLDNGSGSLRVIDLKNQHINNSLNQKIHTFAYNLKEIGPLTTDKDNNVYLADFYGKGGPFNPTGTTIRKIAPNGAQEIFSRELSTPTAIITDIDNNLYIANAGKNEIVKISQNGNKKTIVSNIISPKSIILNNHSELYVLHRNDNTSFTISKFDLNGNKSSLSPTILSGTYKGLAIDNDGNLYTVNNLNGEIIKISPSGSTTKLAKVPGVGGIMVGDLVFYNAHLYLTALSNHRVFKVSLTGKVNVFAGNGDAFLKDGPLHACSFKYPYGLTINHKSGTLYIQDSSSGSLREIKL